MIKLKIKLRKWTTPIHWLYGTGCVLAAVKCFPASLALLLFLALWEIWDDYCHPEKESWGCDDFLEAFAVFASGFLVVLILDYASVLSIGWK